MCTLKINSNVDKELGHLGAGEQVTVVGFHVATDGIGQCAPDLNVLHVVCVELL